MNDSNNICNNRIESRTQVNGSNLRLNVRRKRSRSVRTQSLSPRRSRRTRIQNLINSSLNESNTSMGSLISNNNTTNNSNNSINTENIGSNETNNENGVNSNDNHLNNETINLCIDLTEDDSIVENNFESDSEIQCISTITQDSDLCIVRDIKRNNRRNNRNNERSRSPIRRRQRTVQNDDIIEINESHINNDTNGQNSGTNRKNIKCPVCLDDFTMFKVSGRQLVSTNCGHLFCDRCIKEVIRTSKSCPNCRKKIATQKSFHPIYL